MKDACCLMKLWVCFKAWYLYTTNPVDASIWKQMKWVSWWILLLISLVPLYGVQPLFFLMIFIMIDKSDEFQIVFFICSFKKLQFFTVGFLNGLIGYLRFFICGTFFDQSEAQSPIEEYQVCAAGSGLFILWLVDACGFALQIILIWWAFIMLPCSKVKGRPNYRYFYNAEELKNSALSKKRCCEGCCGGRGCLCSFKRGGRLKSFMLFDLIILVLDVGICCIIFFFFGEQEDHQIKQVYYIGKVFYGLCSLPWVVFIWKPIVALFCKSRPTKYDKYGNCVPDIVGVKFREAESEEEDLVTELMASNTFEELLMAPEPEPNEQEIRLNL